MPVLDPTRIAGYLKIIHGEYRTFLLNKKYYGYHLGRYQRINRTMEILIAVGATGSGIAGLAVWQAGVGASVWAVISALSIILSTIKPILDIPKQIERCSKLAGEYATLFETTRILEQDVSAAKTLTTEQVETFNQIRKRSIELAELDDRLPNRQLIAQLQHEVNNEIPPASLWMPPAAAITAATA